MINREGRRIQLYVVVQCLPLGVLENHLLSAFLYGILGSQLVSILIVMVAKNSFNTVEACGKV